MRLHSIGKSAAKMKESDLKVLNSEQLDGIHKIMFDMLSDIDSVCRKYGLRYILIGGTAIGALRHKGFIPWDDDIDIAMPRKDYNRFYNIITKKYSYKYTLTDAIHKNNYGKVIPKLRLNGTVYRTFLDVDPKDAEINADVFVIENIFDNLILRQLHGVACLAMGFALSCRRIYESRSFFLKNSDDIEIRIRSFIGMFFSFASLSKWAEWTERCYSLCKNDDSEYISIPSDGPHYFRGLRKRGELCRLTEKEFEGKKFYLPVGYDKYLKSIYKDYMKIPSEENRVRSYYSELDLGKYQQRSI